MLHFTDNSSHLGQTSSDSLSGLSYELFYSTGFTTFIDQLSVEVLLLTMPPKIAIESFFTTSSKRTSRQNETAADEGEVGRGGCFYFQFYFQTPTFYFAPPSLHHPLRNCYQDKWSYPICCGLPVDRAVGKEAQNILTTSWPFLGVRTCPTHR